MLACMHMNIFEHLHKTNKTDKTAPRSLWGVTNSTENIKDCNVAKAKLSLLLLGLRMDQEYTICG